MRAASLAWAHSEQQLLWTENSTCREAKMFLKGPDFAVTRYALSLRWRDMHTLVSIITNRIDT